MRSCARIPGGKASIDDFVKRFYAGTSGQPALKPFVEDDVYAALTSVVQPTARHHPPAPELHRTAGAARGARTRLFALDLLTAEKQLPGSVAEAHQGHAARLVDRLYRRQERHHRRHGRAVPQRPAPG